VKEIEPLVPIIVALLGGVGIRLLELVVTRHSRQTRNAVALKRAELERDKWIVDRATLMVERLERQLADANKKIANLEGELVNRHAQVRMLEIENGNLRRKNQNAK